MMIKARRKLSGGGLHSAAWNSNEKYLPWRIGNVRFPIQKPIVEKVSGSGALFGAECLQR
jgi:hypothetical protein